MARPFFDRQRMRLAVPLVLFFGIGMGITAASALSYWVLAKFARIDPNVSLLLVFVVFTLIGFAAHGRVTFGGHARTGSPAARLLRYATVSVTGFMVNEFFIFALVKLAGGAVWWPIVPLIVVTPWLLFAFNRYWVFPEESE
jgi:putative flippase GtrA